MREHTPMISKRSVDTLLDLVEIKLNCMQVLDREDAKELAMLESCRRDLLVLRTSLKGAKPGRAVGAFAKAPPRPAAA